MLPHQPTKNETIQQISPLLLEEISAHIGAYLGLNYPQERWGDLERALRSIAEKYRFDEIETSLKEIFSSTLTRKQIEILASHLVVGETYFFREKDTFETLERNILPELIALHREDRRIRIWSAGCSTGEEAYSIAILLSRLIPDWADWNILILATDVSMKSLKKAATGLYGEWSFRQTPSWVKEQYFDNPNKSNYRIHEHIKKRVVFSYLNLAEDTYPSLINNTSEMDIIFCRNVLMYFTSEAAQKCIRRFYKSLLPDGWFLVSSSEGHYLSEAGFAAVNFPNTILYRKGEAKESQSTVQHQLPTDPYPAYLDMFAEEQYILPPYPPLFEEPFNSEGEMAPPVPDGYADALSLLEKGRYQESIEKILTTLDEKQDDPQAMALLARAYANCGQLDRAEDCCRKAIAADRLNPVYYYLLANILQESGKPDQALELFKTVIYLDYEFVLAHFALGNLFRQKGMIKESTRHFKNARSLLNVYQPANIIPESEGLTVLRLKEIIDSIMSSEAAA